MCSAALTHKFLLLVGTFRVFLCAGIATEEVLVFLISVICLLEFKSCYPVDLFLANSIILCFFPGVASFEIGNLAVSLS